MNLIASLVNVMEGNFDVARKYKEDAKELILFKLKPLLRESQSRGYSLLINNQQISYLEDVIEYKENHDGDLDYLEDMKHLWDKSFNQISFEPLFCRRLLFLFRFIFPKKDLFTTEIIFGNILRKYGFYEQSKTILKKQQNIVYDIINEEKDENNLLILNEQKIKIDLNYNKTLFRNGEINEAIKQAKILVDLLDEKNEGNIYQKISNKLKGRIYGEYALYTKKKFFFTIDADNKSNSNQKVIEQQYLMQKSNRFLTPRLVHRNIFLLGEDWYPKIKSKIMPKNSVHSRDKVNSYQYKFDEYFNSSNFKKDIKKVNSINEYLSLATKYYDKSHKYWYYFTNLNYECYRYLHLKRLMAKEKGADMDSKNILLCKNIEITYAKNAIKGIKNCLSLSGNNMKKGFQSCIKLVDIFFSLGGENDEILDSIFNIIK